MQRSSPRAEPNFVEFEDAIAFQLRACKNPNLHLSINCSESWRLNRWKEVKVEFVALLARVEDPFTVSRAVGQ